MSLLCSAPVHVQQPACFDELFRIEDEDQTNGIQLRRELMKVPQPENGKDILLLEPAHVLAIHCCNDGRGVILEDDVDRVSEDAAGDGPSRDSDVRVTGESSGDRHQVFPP